MTTLKVVKGVVVRNIFPMISNLSSIGLNPITNSLEKENDFNGIRLKFNFKGRTRKYSGNVERKWLLNIDDILVDGYSQDVSGDLV